MRRRELELAIERDPASIVDLVLALEAKVQKLEELLNRNSQNSSKPPSADLPATRKKRRELERKRRKRSSRSPGGQPGHEGFQRQMVPAEYVDELFEYLPECCTRCGEAFDGTEDEVGEAVRRQEWEIPEVKPLVFEHRQLRLCCPNCGKAQLASLPDGTGGSAFGPRLHAHIATLAGVYRLSRSQVAGMVEEMFGIEISTGAVDKAIMRMSSYLEDPWLALREAVRQADVVHADETGWPNKGAQKWLWLAASSLLACYHIDPSRGQKAAKKLLGYDFGQIAVTDRYRGYLWLNAVQRQLCWAHVIRQLRSLSERNGAPGRLGKKLLRQAHEVFDLHRSYLTKERPPQWLKAQLKPTMERIHELLSQGRRSRHKQTARFCTGLIGDWDSLWLFVTDKDVPLTNNQAERGLRHPVIMRKIQLGTQSHKGDRWIERVCSVRETCRLQKRSVLGYLTDVAAAARIGEPIPSLVPP